MTMTFEDYVNSFNSEVYGIIWFSVLIAVLICVGYWAQITTADDKRKRDARAEWLVKESIKQRRAKVAEHRLKIAEEKMLLSKMQRGEK